MPPSPVQMCIDGKWVACLPAEDFGFLGIRYICELGASPGQPNRKLLIRASTWPQAGAPAGTRPPPLAHARNSEGTRNGFRSVSQKTYQQAIPQPNGKLHAESCAVVQQDITGLVS